MRFLTWHRTGHDDAVPQLPPAKSPDARGVEALILGIASAVPLVGGLLSSSLQGGLAAGQEKLLRVYLSELAEAQDRFLLRLGHAELQAFLARKEAAAAINQATHIALRTPSTEKHRLLGAAVLNAATTLAEDPLVPYFWSLIEKHSALEVRLLAVLDDPINRAVDNGEATYIAKAIESEDWPVLGVCMFAALPELNDLKWSNDDGEEGWSEDGEESPDGEDEFDEEPVDGPADPGWLLEHLAGRLHADGLLDDHEGGDAAVQLLLFESDDFLSIRLHTGRDFHPDATGYYPARSFSYLSHLGARYLAFLTRQPAGTHAAN